MGASTKKLQRQIDDLRAKLHQAEKTYGRLTDRRLSTGSDLGMSEVERLCAWSCIQVYRRQLDALVMERRGRIVGEGGCSLGNRVVGEGLRANRTL